MTNLKTLPIYTYGFDVLRKKTKRITKVDDHLIELIGSMFNTMHKAHGIGLASPQVGKDIALTVIDLSRADEDKKIKFEPLTLINPVIKDYHGEAVMEEGCLSIPLVRAEVTRPETVYLEYQDLDLNKQYVEINGLLARVVQHEVDHLNGILFIDHLDKDQKKKLKAELNKIKKGDITTDYLLAEIPKQKQKVSSKKSRH
ncbi:MAG: peptide deformylase [Chlorobi bacterium]|nr:peptide deformylase [Chlorobiota bacterium]MCI0717170.1 peptide deformylase [Chlorobiota bacterium]